MSVRQNIIKHLIRHFGNCHAFETWSTQKLVKTKASVDKTIKILNSDNHEAKQKILKQLIDSVELSSSELTVKRIK